MSPRLSITRDRSRGDVVIAVDAGGSNTRVGCFSLDGDLLAQRTGTGGSLTHNDDAAEAWARSGRSSPDPRE
jgi:glucosamine kinase